MPLRFWLPKEDGCDIIVLDASLEDGLAIREHNLKGSDGKYGNFERCLADTNTECPVCKKYAEEGYLVLLLTILVLKEWRNKKTNELHDYSKMLLPVKRGQFKVFRRLEQICIKKHGTMRGMCLALDRGNDPQSSAIGEPGPMQDGSAFDFYTEDQLKAEFGHAAVKNRDGKQIKEADEDIRAYNYKKLFPEPSEEELSDRHGVEPTPGSRRSNESELKEDAAPPAHSRTRRPAQTETEAAPSRRRSRPTPTAPVEEEDDIPFK